jgi:hypothetical protein
MGRAHPARIDRASLRHRLITRAHDCWPHSWLTPPFATAPQPTVLPNLPKPIV